MLYERRRNSSLAAGVTLMLCVCLACSAHTQKHVALPSRFYVCGECVLYLLQKQTAGRRHKAQSYTPKKNHMRRIRANIGAFRYEIYVLHSTITKIKYLISIFCVIRSAHCLRATRQTANNHICETHCATNGYFYSTLHATIYKEFVKCDWGLLVCLITMWTFAEKELNLD